MDIGLQAMICLLGEKHGGIQLQRTLECCMQRMDPFHVYSLKQLAPENRPGPKGDDRLSTIHFQVRYFSFWECSFPGLYNSAGNIHPGNLTSIIHPRWSSGKSIFFKIWQFVITPPESNSEFTYEHVSFWDYFPFGKAYFQGLSHPQQCDSENSRSLSGFSILSMEEIRRSPVEVGSLSDDLKGFFIPKVVVWDFWTINSRKSNSNSTTYHPLGYNLTPSNIGKMKVFFRNPLVALKHINIILMNPGGWRIASQCFSRKPYFTATSPGFSGSLKSHWIL